MRLQTEASRNSSSPGRSLSDISNGHSPAKRQGKIANGSTKSESIGSYMNGHSHQVRPIQTSFYGHDREEVTRIIIQGLTDLGYNEASKILSRESGFELEGPTVAAFRSAVLNGQWEEAEHLLFGSESSPESDGVSISNGSKKNWSPSRHGGGLTLAEGANHSEMLFWMRQQKYLELLEGRDLAGALAVLRQELTPLHQDGARLRALSSLIMCQTAEQLKYEANWDGAAGESRNHLLSELSRSISPSVMIPEHRLAVLLSQAKDNWIRNCLYHNTGSSPSLYVDHTCDRVDFPLRTILELRHHTDEVWFLKFSNDGTKLATTGKDSTIIVYETTHYKVLFTLTGHEAGGVCYIAWSPDDTKLISCGQIRDNSARLWDVRESTLITNVGEFTYAVTSAAWAPNGQTFLIGSQDASRALCVWNLNGDAVYQFQEEGLRVYDLAISPDGQRLVVLEETRILVFDFVTKEKLVEWRIDDVKLTSVTISADSRRMLVSMNESKIRLMDIDTGQILQGFDGNRQSNFIIRSSFGGAGEGFVVSGSEDARIYIWRTNGHLVEALEAHKPGCVNSVTWHPNDPTTFASAGDDHKVRMCVFLHISP
ncbi:WD40 repeat-like protein [Patellaria atrata CBS 101060]|uniref:WD40 repeat-like protein n=1 Tax=Patellaria atrata CBS 101060 TaxID=1346257 RepID=A0A9P4SG73_9PEZI|nr:WD40 repeat-like protein [Patellaria atrata CBS 101060]